MNIVTRNWRDLIRPRGIHIESETLTEFYGKFTAEPLERGYGITIGNSLRRILLSSLQGAAITAVRIDGALHEFTSVTDVVEDVTDIVLNLKEVVLKAAQAKTYTVRIEKEGPGTVHARDIQLVDGLQVLNPDHVIATLDKKGPLVIELTVSVGRGYVPEQHGRLLSRVRGSIRAAGPRRPSEPTCTRRPRPGCACGWARPTRPRTPRIRPVPTGAPRRGRWPEWTRSPARSSPAGSDPRQPRRLTSFLVSPRPLGSRRRSSNPPLSSDIGVVVTGGRLNDARSY